MLLDMTGGDLITGILRADIVSKFNLTIFKSLTMTDGRKKKRKEFQKDERRR